MPVANLATAFQNQARSKLENSTIQRFEVIFSTDRWAVTAGQIVDSDNSVFAVLYRSDTSKLTQTPECLSSRPFIFIFVSCIHRGQASSSRSHPCYSASKKRTNYKHTKVFKSNWCTVLKCSLYNLDHNTDSSPFLKYFCDIKKFSLFLSVMLCYGPLIFEIPLLLINAELVFLENNLLITALS